MSEGGGFPSDDEASPFVSALARADAACAFGPSFFLTSLKRFVRDNCPSPREKLPVVELRLVSGETLLLCHVIGVSARWVMLAVVDNTTIHRGGMSVEFVPYELICGVSVRAGQAEGEAIGFAQTRVPDVIAPEVLVRAAMTSGPADLPPSGAPPNTGGGER